MRTNEAKWIKYMIKTRSNLKIFYQMTIGSLNGDSGIKKYFLTTTLVVKMRDLFTQDDKQ